MKQTPEPNFDKHHLNYLEIPKNFDNFNNNIISVGFGVWDDGDYSQIFNWVVNNNTNSSDFEKPNGWVFAAEIVNLRDL